MKKEDNYAGNQVRILLGDLKNSSHTVKVKAIQTFQSYIEQYHPKIGPSNVDYLYTGCINGNPGLGLIYWCGVNAEKHTGKLKRICGPAISLVNWLVNLDGDADEPSVFYERFVRLPVEELMKLNFQKHILRLGEGKFSVTGNKKRLGSDEDAFEILALLMNDHRSLEGEDEPVDVNYLMAFNKSCQDKFNEWIQKEASAQLSNTMAQFRVHKVGRALEAAENRPTRWVDVEFKCVPAQEGEDNSVEIDPEPEPDPVVPDPLGLTPTDLRVTQKYLVSGELTDAVEKQKRRGTGNTHSNVGVGLLSKRKSGLNLIQDFEELEEEDDNDSVDPLEIALYEEQQNTNRQRRASSMSGRRSSTGTTASKNNEKRPFSFSGSVLPSDKNFSPYIFLGLLHGERNFMELTHGLEHLKEQLQQQSSQRENLVRLHFGLFVECADGLEWLKGYRKGVYKSEEFARYRTRRSSSGDMLLTDATRTHTVNFGTSTDSVDRASERGVVGADKGMEQLQEAQTTLDYAKKEAQRTLAPILESMRRSRRVKSAEKVLRKMSAVLEYPGKMRHALERGDLHEVVQIYKRVLAIPTNTNMRILQRIKSASDSVAVELKRHCFSVLLTPNPNYHALLRHAKLLWDLEDINTYLEAIRLSFVRQLLSFVESLRELRDRFFLGCVEAYDKSLEQNLLKKSPFFNNPAGGSAEKESVTSIVKKHFNQGHVRRRSFATKKHEGRHRNPSIVSAGDSSQGPGRARRDTGESTGLSLELDEDMEVRSSISQLRSSGHAGPDPRHEDFDEFDVDRDVEQDWMEADDLDAFFEETFRQEDPNFWVTKNNNNVFDVSLSRSDSSQNLGFNNNNGSVETRHGIILCAIVRQNFNENLVFLLTKWFPCLYRLVSELNKHHGVSERPVSDPLSNKPVGSSVKPTRPTSIRAATNNAIGGSAVKEEKSQTHEFINRQNKHHGSKLSQIDGAKLLGSTLSLVSLHIQQTVCGLTPALSSFVLPPELNSAFTELNQHASNLANNEVFNTNLNQTSSSFSVSSLTATANSISNSVVTLGTCPRFDNKAYDSVLQNLLPTPLRQPFRRDALQEIYELFDAMEAIIKSDIAPTEQNNINNNSEYGFMMDFDGRSSVTNFEVNSRTPFGRRNTNELDLPVNSPYTESLETLRQLAMEGELSLAQRIMDRLLELSCRVGDMERLNNEKQSFYQSMDNLHQSQIIPTRKMSLTTSMWGFNTSLNMGLNAGLNSLPGRNGRDKFNSAEVKKNSHEIPSDATVAENRIENSVKEMEKLVIRCLRNIISKIKRPDWVSPVVRDGVIKSTSSFSESLRREAAQLGDFRGLVAPVDQSTRKRSLKSTSIDAKTPFLGTKRQSRHNSQVIMPQDELKLETADSKKADFLLDLLRACVRMRCRAIPKLWKMTTKLFTHENMPTGLNHFSPFSWDSPFNTHSPTRERSSTVLESPSNLGMINPVPSDTINTSNALFSKTRSYLQKKPSSFLNKLFSTDPEFETETAANPVPPQLTSDDGNIPELTLLDRLTRAVDRQCNVDGQYLRQMSSILHDIVRIEVKTVKAFLSLKQQQLSTAVLAGYSLLTHRELSGNWKGLKPSEDSVEDVVPKHLSRVLLMVGHEKVVLMRELGKITVESGGKLSETSKDAAAECSLNFLGESPLREKGGFGQGEVGAEDRMWGYTRRQSDPGVVEYDSDSDISLSVPTPLESSKSRRQQQKTPLSSPGKSKKPNNTLESVPTRYRDHVYLELCESLLLVYEDLIIRLQNNSFINRDGNNRFVGEGVQDSRFTLQHDTSFRSTASDDIGEGLIRQNTMFLDVNSLGLSRAPSFATGAAQNVSFKCLTPLSLGQAKEEFEFLKAILRPLLKNSPVLDRNPLTTEMLQENQKNISKNSFASKAQLLHDAKMISVIITH